ncbi:hypothetical protein ACIRFH_11725 [Streptomyces sp. NPDC093586]|uniref:hypothetical protein n=1 Tax=Streptomyces sp. NPDC093586 TaxID=3366042 RepID=UPI00381B1958
MPGQRKRRRAERDASRRTAVRADPDTGHWDVLFETQDERQWHAHLRALRAGEERIDWAATRIDTLCGRLSQPTTYRLSVFVRSA